jgi:hypothetical protein
MDGDSLGINKELICLASSLYCSHTDMLVHSAGHIEMHGQPSMDTGSQALVDASHCLDRKVPQSNGIC